METFVNSTNLEIFLETLKSDLSEPDVNQLWHDRLARNSQAISNVLPRLSKASHHTKIASTSSTSEESAVVSIQKYVRAFLAKRRFLSLLQQKFEKDEEERRLKQLEQVEEGELLVQNHLLQRELEDDLIVVRNVDLQYIYAASIIQQAWRKYWRRKKKVGSDQVG